MSTIRTLNIYTQEYNEPIKCKYNNKHMTADECLNQYLIECLNGNEKAELTFYNGRELSDNDMSSMIEVVGMNIYTDSVINWESN